MDKQMEEYTKDKRTECKFGVKCYQKNPLHHKKFKHPPKKRSPPEDDNISPQVVKKYKSDDNGTTASSTIKISNDISDSDDEIIEDDKPSDVQDIIPKNDGTNGTSNSTDTENTKNNNGITLKLETLDAKKKFIKEKFLVEMPDDFYTFWDFCQSLNRNNPCNAFSIVNLTLVGPYDVLADKFSHEKPPEEYLIHWRYFHDPPEFQTILKGNDSTGYHIGYFRDDPLELPVFVGSNCAAKDGEITVMGDNIFAAVSSYLEETLKSSNPFQKMSITKLHTAVKKRASELNLDLSDKTSSIKAREKKILARTFNRAGLIVPYNRKTQLGYRHLCVGDKELKKVLDRVANCSTQQRQKVMSDLQPILTATDIAIDECDFGTGLELGWDILAHKVDSLNSTIQHFLCTAYDLMQRSAFTEIATAHMANRKTGSNLSIL